MAGVRACLAKNHTGEPAQYVFFCEEFLAEKPVLMVANLQNANSIVLFVDSKRGSM
jgi:hypothetical protein